MTLPDLPRWVEAHGIAADPTGWRRDLGAGFALGHDGAKLIVIAGEPSADAVAALARELPSHTLLLPSPIAIAPRVLTRAILHTLPDPEVLPDLEGATALPLDATLDHLPIALAEEVAAARGSRTIWSAWLDGEPVSFAYAPWRSATLFDVSVETLPAARQLGLATIVAAAMIRDERAHGREPVWGADEHNVASLRLAERLGFTAVDTLWVAPP